LPVLICVIWLQLQVTFTYKSADANGADLLVANPNYVQGAPLLDEIVLIPNSRDSVMVAGVSNGNIDIAELHEPLQLANTAPYSATQYAQNIFGVAAFNLRPDHLLADTALRLAIQHAISQTTALDMVLPQSWAATPISATTTTVISDANTLFDQAGWDTRDSAGIRQKSGVSLQMTLLAPVDNPLLIQHADQYAAVLQALDIAVVRHNLPHAEYVGQLIHRMILTWRFLNYGHGRSSAQYADTWLYDPDPRALYRGRTQSGCA
jgi:ABC-type transport system substrate-binding protein